jgi:hypothetical protein
MKVSAEMAVLEVSETWAAYAGKLTSSQRKSRNKTTRTPKKRLQRP